LERQQAPAKDAGVPFRNPSQATRKTIVKLSGDGLGEAIYAPPDHVHPGAIAATRLHLEIRHDAVQFLDSTAQQ
jgi:hypothetical protein